MYNVIDVIGMNFKGERQNKEGMKMVIVYMYRSDDGNEKRSRMRKRQVARYEEVKKR